MRVWTPQQRVIYGLRVALLGAAAVTYWLIPAVHDFLHTGFSYLRHHDMAGLRRFIQSYGIWAPLSSIVLMTLQSVVPLVPGVMLTLANAWLFGWILGACYSWWGALLGAVLDFVLARSLGRPWVSECQDYRWLQKVENFLAHYGVWAIVLTRMTPVIPFKVVSYGAGFTQLPLRRYILATAIGQAPPILLYSFLGERLEHNWHWLIVVSLLSLIAALMLLHHFKLINLRILSHKRE